MEYEIESLNVAFAKAQQDMVDSFKKQLTKVAEEAISTIYTDTSLHAVNDAQINFRNQFRDEIRKEFESEIKSKYSYFSWAYDMRMLLLKNHKEEISNKIIEDLQDRVKSLEDHIEQMRRFR